MIDTKQLPEMLEELRNVISSVSGVKSISETFSLSYIVQVETEKDKAAVERVGALLSAQAEKFGFVLEVTPATKAEIDDAQTKFAEHLAENTKFKS